MQYPHDSRVYEITSLMPNSCVRTIFSFIFCIEKEKVRFGCMILSYDLNISQLFLQGVYRYVQSILEDVILVPEGFIRTFSVSAHQSLHSLPMFFAVYSIPSAFTKAHSTHFKKSTPIAGDTNAPCRLDGWRKMSFNST